jgi:hypothetical protein
LAVVFFFFFGTHFSKRVFQNELQKKPTLSTRRPYYFLLFLLIYSIYNNES